MKRKRNRCDIDEFNYKIIKCKTKNSLYILSDLDKELLNSYNNYNHRKKKKHY